MRVHKNWKPVALNPHFGHLTSTPLQSLTQSIKIIQTDCRANYKKKEKKEKKRKEDLAAKKTILWREKPD